MVTDESYHYKKIKSERRKSTSDWGNGYCSTDIGFMKHPWRTLITFDSLCSVFFSQWGEQRGKGTGDEGFNMMADMKNRCACNDSVVFSHHSQWLLVVCTLSERPVMHKHAHKHANMSKHTWMFTLNYIYLNIRDKREPNRERKRARAKEVEGSAIRWDDNERIIIEYRMKLLSFTHNIFSH